MANTDLCERSKHWFVSSLGYRNSTLAVNSLYKFGYNLILLCSKQMDRRWIHGTQFTPEYMEGVRQFMEFAAQKLGKDVDIPCPCRRCLNLESWPQPKVDDHIHLFGMSATYTRWIHHGELMDGMEVEFVQDEVHETGIDGFGIDVGECAVARAIMNCLSC